MPKQAQRRFVGLDTEEVSLVDTPANEVEFLVKKNQTEDRDMGAQAETTMNDDAVRVPVEVADGEAVAKALEHVGGIIDKISTMVTTKAASEEPATEDDATTTEDATDDVDTAKGGIKSILQAAGMKGKALEEAMAKLKKAGLDGIEPEPVTKNADGEADDEARDEDDQPLTFATLQKAARFTPTRITQIQDAVETLKLVLEAIGQGQSPATKTPGVENHPNPNTTRRLAGSEKKPVMKGGDMAGVLKALGDAVEGLGDRLEAIEKARPASNSVEDDADIPDTDAQPTQKSIWSGLL